MKMQLGRLPADPDKRRLLIGAPTWAIPTPPPAVDNLSRIYPLDMGGNDAWGDCVVVACRTSFEVSWKTLTSEPMPAVTAADCIADYKAAGHYSSPPGDGLVTEQFLDWLLVHGLTSDPRTKPLAWGSIHKDWTSIEEVDAEFVGGIYGVVVHAAQEYPARVWDGGAGQGQIEGGHEIGGGRYDPTYVYANTWAYQCQLTKSFVGNPSDFNEHHVIIWPHVWASLTPERRTQIAADFQALTGKEFPTDPTIQVPFADKGADVKTATSLACYINPDGSPTPMAVVQTTRKGFLGGRYTGAAHQLANGQFILDRNFTFR